MKRFIKTFLKKEKGAITYMTAVMLIVLLGFTALAVDFGLHYFTGAKLQNAVDSAATAIADSLGSDNGEDNEFLKQIAYDYLAKNGFDRNGRYKNKIDVKIENVGLGFSNLDEIEDDRDISLGYYKITASIAGSPVMSRIVAKDTSRLDSIKKSAFVKCEPEYVPVPRALNYTVFAGSLEDKADGTAAMNLKGKDSIAVADLEDEVEELIENNGNGSGIFQSVGVSSLKDVPNGDLEKVKLPSIITDGDVHSNSNITIGVQALNASRVMTQHYGNDNNVEAYESLGKQINSALDDYGQVTYTAVKDIKFNHVGKPDNETHVYVQNQQYVQRTRAILKIVDIMDFTNISTHSAFVTEYRKAANAYLNTTPFLTEDQKIAISGAVSDNQSESALVYDNAENKFSLKNQESIVYNVSQSKANEFLGSVKGFKTYNELLDDYTNNGGIDALKKSNGSFLYDPYDIQGDIDYEITYYKKDADGEIIIDNPVDLTVSGTQVNRDYTKILPNSNPTAQTTFGAKFAIASTFRENSDFISMPNLKPYFTRQVNKSIRNATKTKEEDGDSSAGAEDIKNAVSKKKDEYNQLLQTTKFTDNKYKNPESLIKMETSPLFTKFKEKNSGLTYYYDETYSTESNSWVREFNKSYENGKKKHKTFNGFNLYNSSGFLKTPTDFVQEKRTEIEENKTFGKSAIKKYYDSIKGAYEGAVGKKRTEISNAQDNNTIWKYLKGRTDARNKINDVAKPSIVQDNSPGERSQIIRLEHQPNPDEVFLGEGQTRLAPQDGSNIVSKNSVIRKEYDNAFNTIRSQLATNYGVVYNSSANTYTLTKNTSGFTQNSSYSRITSDLVFQNNTYYTNTLYSNYRWFYAEKGGTTYTNKIVLDGDKVNVIVKNNTTLHTGTIDASAAWQGKVEVQSGSTLYVHGDLIMSNNGKIDIKDNAKLIVEGKILSANKYSDKTYSYLWIGNGSTVVQLSPGEQQLRFEYGSDSGASTSTFNNATIFAVGDIKANPVINLTGSSTLYALGKVDAAELSLKDNARAYVGGDVYSSYYMKIYGDSRLYVLGNVYSNNKENNEYSGINADYNKNNFFEMKGTAKVYVRGALTSTSSSPRHIWINNATGCVLSVLGNNASDCFRGKCSQIFDESSGTQIYLGTDTTIYQNNVNNLTGTFYCFGNLSFPEVNGNVVKLTSNSDFYVAGNLNIPNGQLEAKASGGPTMQIDGNANVKIFYIQYNTKLHVHGNASGTTLDARNDCEIDVLGDINYPNKQIYSGSKILEASAEMDTQPDNIVINGFKNKHINYSIIKKSMTMSGCRILITKSVELEGDLKLTNTVLYIQGDLICNNINLNGSQLYVDGNVTVRNNLNAVNDSLFLLRKGNVVEPQVLDQVYNLTVSGFINASSGPSSSGSKIYVDGAINAKGYTASGTNTKIFGYKAANINYTTADYNRDNPTQAYYDVDGNAAEIFCGTETTFKNAPGLIINGYFFLKPKSGGLTVKKLHVKERGYASIGGANGGNRLTVDGWAAIDAGGFYLHNGLTKLKNCRITNKGTMYLIGGVDMTEAATQDLRAGQWKSEPDFLLYDNSESFIGHFYNGSTKLNKYIYKGNFETRGETYFECTHIEVNGWLTNQQGINAPGIGRDLDNEITKMNWTGVSVNVSTGTTYINGDFHAYTNVNPQQAGILIGKSKFVNNSSTNLPGLVVEGELHISGPIWNFGKLYVFEKIVQEEYDEAGGWRANDLANTRHWDAGRVILNGLPESTDSNYEDCAHYREGAGGLKTPVIYCGGVQLNNGTFETFNWTIYGWIENYAQMYINANMDVRGYLPQNHDVDYDNVSQNVYEDYHYSNPYWGRYAFRNGSGAKAHFGGWVRLNSNRLFNEWKDANNLKSYFTCEGKLTYGSVVYNCSNMYVGGDITNNEAYAETCRPDKRKYYDDQAYVLGEGGRSESEYWAFMNGCYKINEDMVNASNHYKNSGYKNFAAGDKMYPEAELYCGGKLQVGVDKCTMANYNDLKGKHGGSVFNVGNAFIGSDLNVYSFDKNNDMGLSGGISGTHTNSSYYFTSLWTWHNSNTFVGGNTYSGAGTVIGSGSIFMTGKDFTSARALKLNANIYANHTGNFFMNWGVGNHVNVDDEDLFREAYFYVGENLLANTFGRRNRENASVVGFVESFDSPKDWTRDTNIYSNTNIYIGGSFYNNAKLNVKQNVTMLIAGQKDLMSKKQNGSVDQSDVLDDFTNAAADSKIKELLDTNYRLFVYQLFDEDICSTLVVNGDMFVQDTCQIRDMCQNYIYGDFSTHDFVELGMPKDLRDNTDAYEDGFRTPKEQKRIDGEGENKGIYKNYNKAAYMSQYVFENAPYMLVDGNYCSGERLKSDDPSFDDNSVKTGRDGVIYPNYTRLFASATLRVNGFVNSKKQIDLRHDARIYANGFIFATTNIDSAEYTHLICTGAMTANGRAPENRQFDWGFIRVRDQSLIATGGDMKSTAYIEIGEEAKNPRANVTINQLQGLDPSYGNGDDTEQEISGGSTEGSGSYTDEDKPDSDPNVTGYLDTHSALSIPDDNDNAFGTMAFIKGSMYAERGHIKEFAYSSIMTGQVVYASGQLVVRHNADLWVMPELFGNNNYDSSMTDQSTDTKDKKNNVKLFNLIRSDIKNKSGLKLGENFKVKSGSTYSIGSLYLGKNASIMGTYDCQVPAQCTLRENSLIYMGHDFTCSVIGIQNNDQNQSQSLFTGGTETTGFGSYGKAVQGRKFVCKNKTGNGHNGKYYSMTVTMADIPEKFKCPKCKREYTVGGNDPLLSDKASQVSYPVVVYAYNSIDIASTIDMNLTYLVANKGKVNIHNLKTTTKNAENNAKELPNAICSYRNNIDYFARDGQMGALFYAPRGNVNLDGYTSEIWGSVIGNTVEMNSRFLALHRFTNWRTMQLNIAESGKIYLISEDEYNSAEESNNYLGNGYLINETNKCPSCNDKIEDSEFADGYCSECGYQFSEGAFPFFF